MEVSSLQLEVMQKATELVVHERMTKGGEVKCTKEEKKVKGWSIEEMKGKVTGLVERDTEEMIKWRGFESGRDRSMLEEFGGQMRLTFWTSTRSKMPSRPHKEQSGSVKRSWDSSQIENERRGGRGGLAKEGPDGRALG